jgi:hypothetical protein
MAQSRAQRGQTILARAKAKSVRSRFKTAVAPDRFKVMLPLWIGSSQLRY